MCPAALFSLLCPQQRKTGQLRLCQVGPESPTSSSGPGQLLGWSARRDRGPACTLSQAWRTLAPRHPGARLACLTWAQVGGLPESWLGPAQGAFGAEETPDPRGVPGVGPAFPADLGSQSLVPGWKKVAARSPRPTGRPQGGLLRWAGRKSEARQRRDAVRPCLIQSPANSKAPE